MEMLRKHFLLHEPYQAAFDQFFHQIASGIAWFCDHARKAGSSLEPHCSGALTPLVHWGPSQNHSFSQWFSTFSKSAQRCLQLMIKSVAHCFAKSSEGSEDRGQGPYRENVHFHKVFKGFRPIGQVLVLLVRSAFWALWPPVEFQWRHLRNTRISNVFEGFQGSPWSVCGMHGSSG